MKVLIFSWEYPPHMVGGLGQHVYDLSRFLVRNGVCVHIITPRVKYYPDYQEENGVHIHRVGSAYREVENFKSWTFRFNSEAIREAVVINGEVGGFDIIHAHDWLVAYAGRSVARIFEIPLVTTIHATEHGRNLGLHNRFQMEINEIERNLALEADRVICCSRYMQHEISSLFGRPAEELTIIPNGVDPSLFLPMPERPRFTINDDEEVVFFIGRLVPEKGVCFLLRAFPKVLKEVPNARLYIGGRGPQQKELERMVLGMDLDEQIQFTGFIYSEERNYVYQKAKVAVFPSLYEPFGIVALEAMATSTPVVVADTGGLGEIVESGVTGIKVAPGDENELAEAIIRILKDKTLADKLRANSAEVIETTYSWDVIARSTAEVYNEALSFKTKPVFIHGQI